MSTYKDSFPKSKDKLLIELIRRNPVLYDYAHERYRDVRMKQTIWNKISAEIDFPVKKTKKRWCQMRNNYLRNIRLASKRRARWDHTKLEFLAIAYKLPIPRKAEPRAASPASPAPAPIERIVYVVPPGEYDFPAPVKTEACSSPEPPREAEPPAPPPWGRSVVHRYFDSMADVVAQLPLALAHEACQRVYRLVTELTARAVAPDA